jgi:hypothetical protein
MEWTSPQTGTNLLPVLYSMSQNIEHINSIRGSHTMASTASPEQGTTSTSPRTSPRPGSLVLLGILSRRRQRLLIAAGNTSQSTPRLIATHEALDSQQHNLDELLDQYSHSLGLATKLLGTEDPGILEAMSFNSSLQEATSQTHMAATILASEPAGSPRSKIIDQSQRVQAAAITNASRNPAVPASAMATAPSTSAVPPVLSNSAVQGAAIAIASSNPAAIATATSNHTVPSAAAIPTAPKYPAVSDAVVQQLSIPDAASATSRRDSLQVSHVKETLLPSVTATLSTGLQPIPGGASATQSIPDAASGTQPIPDDVSATQSIAGAESAIPSVPAAASATQPMPDAAIVTQPTPDAASAIQSIPDAARATQPTLFAVSAMTATAVPSQAAQSPTDSQTRQPAMCNAREMVAYSQTCMAVTTWEPITASPAAQSNTSNHKPKSSMVFLTSAWLLLSVLDLVLVCQPRQALTSPAKSWYVMDKDTQSNPHHSSKEKNLATDILPQVMCKATILTSAAQSFYLGENLHPNERSYSATAHGLHSSWDTTMPSWDTAIPDWDTNNTAMPSWDIHIPSCSEITSLGEYNLGED